MTVAVLQGDCREVLATLLSGSVQCVVTSPPYFGLRDYGTGTWEGGDPTCDHGAAYVERRQAERQKNVDGGTPGSLRDKPRSSCRCGAIRVDKQIGLEQSPAEYVAQMVTVFREARRVLRPDGVAWINIGDSFGKRKQLQGIPWKVALALQDDGWILRQEIIWNKVNAMPESCQDRCTRAHEQVFMFSKSQKYIYDAEAIAEPASLNSHGGKPIEGGPKQAALGQQRGGRMGIPADDTRNARSVWTIATEPSRGLDHYAIMPTALAERCIKAGSRPGDTVLDPFSGVGTSLLCADRLGRHGIGIELNPASVAIARRRLVDDAPLLVEVA